jgi:hypothetical protein
LSLALIFFKWLFNDDFRFIIFFNIYGIIHTLRRGKLNMLYVICM